MLISRSEQIKAIENKDKIWDLIVVGGGATGLGIALDSASRGFKTLLLEQNDFAKGTSSRSTKLVHGGVRYLAQGDIGLVMEALHERGLLLKNAPHLVTNQSFIIPNYRWWEMPFYGIGLMLYDILAGKLSFGRSLPISKKSVMARLPNIIQKKLLGGIVYHDGQFDDARLALNLAQTGIEYGAAILNYIQVNQLTKDSEQRISGVIATDIETGKIYNQKSKIVINATGVFADDLLQKDEPGKKPMIRSSQGIHLVLDRSFLPSQDALMIPKTEDGRVLFAVPWHNKLVIGTTDTPLDDHQLEPKPLESEIEFILKTAAQYLIKAPERKDVLSVFAGLRPLAAPQDGSTKTKEISRTHKLIISKSGLITITGGKWTTYRKMAEDTVNKAINIGKLEKKPCVTAQLPLHGSIGNTDKNSHLHIYGSDKKELLILKLENKDWNEKIHAELPYFKVEVIWAVRYEMARTVEDVLARRVRILFLDAEKAIDVAPLVAKLIAKELEKDEEWEAQQVKEFTAIAKGYLLTE